MTQFNLLIIEAVKLGFAISAGFGFIEIAIAFGG